MHLDQFECPHIPAPQLSLGGNGVVSFFILFTLGRGTPLLFYLAPPLVLYESVHSTSAARMGSPSWVSVVQYFFLDSLEAQEDFNCTGRLTSQDLPPVGHTEQATNQLLLLIIHWARATHGVPVQAQKRVGMAELLCAQRSGSKTTREICPLYL